jgi:hypothetical protein
VSGLRVRGALPLAARAAAARFASPRGKARGPRDAWRPVALRWRSRRRRPENLRARHTTAAAQAVWLPQFHLHFSACVRERIGRGSPPGFPAAASIHDARRIVFDRQWTSIRAATLALHLLRTYRSPRTQAGMAAAHAFRPLGAPPIAPRLADRPRRSLFERTQEGVRAGVPRDARPPVAARPRIPPREPQVSRRPSLAFGHAVARRSPESAASPVRLGRLAELVWRAAPQPPMSVADEGPRVDLPASSHQAPARSFPGPETAAAPPPRAARVAAPQVMSLDPGLLDRLADDVIRRIEKRARIERERRGL